MPDTLPVTESGERGDAGPFSKGALSLTGTQGLSKLALPSVTPATSGV